MHVLNDLGLVILAPCHGWCFVSSQGSAEEFEITYLIFSTRQRRLPKRWKFLPTINKGKQRLAATNGRMDTPDKLRELVTV